MIPGPGGYFYLQVKSSGQYLNILNASTANGAEACQGTNNTTDNFLWQKVPAADGVHFYLKVKSSGQYLNILNASTANGAKACQGTTNTTPNFLWKQIPKP
jgi:hypothetical protein